MFPADLTRRMAFAFAGAVIFAFGTGCQPSIGDACSTSTDCSTQGDRLCDTTQPGGYCTIFNCEPNTCPEDEAACVAFHGSLDPACGSADDGEWARFERSFCMALCEDNSDCRSDYVCIRPDDRDAFVVDDDRSVKVCLARLSTAAADPNGDPPEACFPPETSSSTSSSGGAGGAGGGGGGP